MHIARRTLAWSSWPRLPLVDLGRTDRERRRVDPIRVDGHCCTIIDGLVSIVSVLARPARVRRSGKSPFIYPSTIRKFILPTVSTLIMPSSGNCELMWHSQNNVRYKNPVTFFVLWPRFLLGLFLRIILSRRLGRELQTPTIYRGLWMLPYSARLGDAEVSVNQFGRVLTALIPTCAKRFAVYAQSLAHDPGSFGSHPLTSFGQTVSLVVYRVPKTSLNARHACPATWGKNGLGWYISPDESAAQLLHVSQM